MGLKKILFKVILSLSICCNMCSTVFAANPIVVVRDTYYSDDGVKSSDYYTVIEYEDEKKYLNGIVNLLFINGDIVLDADTIIENGTTLVPIRIISERLNANVNWNSVNKTVEIEKGDIFITVPIGARYITVNGKNIETGTESKIVNSLTYVPLRVIASCFGAEIGFYTQEPDINIISIQNKKEKENITEEEAKIIAEKVYKEEFLPTMDNYVQDTYNKTALELAEEEGIFRIKIAADFGEYYYVTFYDEYNDGLLIDKYSGVCYPVYHNMVCTFGIGQPGYYNQWMWYFGG